MDSSILGSILGSPYFGKLPYTYHITVLYWEHDCSRFGDLLEGKGIRVSLA